jgi:hypothetical protein
MKSVSALLLLLVPLITAQAERWKLDDAKESIQVHGSYKTAAGAVGQSLVLDGSSVIELKDTAPLNGRVTVSVWFNPYELIGAQQVLAGKNRYSRNERQWSLTIEPNGQLRAYLQQDGWSTISCSEALKPGAWHFAALVVEPHHFTAGLRSYLLLPQLKQIKYA